jgi:hypothetical protein
MFVYYIKETTHACYRGTQIAVHAAHIPGAAMFVIEVGRLFLQGVGRPSGVTVDADMR